MRRGPLVDVGPAMYGWGVSRGKFKFAATRTSGLKDYATSTTGIDHTDYRLRHIGPIAVAALAAKILPRLTPPYLQVPTSALVL